MKGSDETSRRFQLRAESRFRAVTMMVSLAVAAVAASVFAAIAVASDAARDAYGGAGAQIAQGVTGVTGNPEGSLPFTGIDLGLLALGGVLAICAGIAIRRLSRRLQ